MTPIPITSKLIVASLKEVTPFIEDRNTGRLTDIREILDFSKSNHSLLAKKFAVYGEVSIPDLIASWESCRIIDQKICVIEALGMIASNKATPFLATCLDSANEDERSYAIKALGQIASFDALKCLREHLPQELNPETRAKLIKVIFKISDQNPGKDIIKIAFSELETNTRRRAVDALQEDSGEDATEMLLNALHDPVWSIANCAASGLKGRNNITQSLLDKLTGKGSDIKILVVRILGDIKAKEAVPALCQLLHESNNKALKSDICKALSKIDDPESIGSLIDALSDSAPEVVIQAAQVLGKMKVKAAIGHLENLLRDRSNFRLNQVDIKKASLTALGNINDSAAVQVLTRALDHKNTYVNLIAAKSLLRQKNCEALPKIKAAMQRMDSDVYKNDFEVIVNKMTELTAKQESKRNALKKK